MTDSRNILLTGSSSGIGYCITQTLLSQSHKITGLCRRAEQTQFDLPGYQGIDIDLANIKTLAKSIKQIAKDTGPYNTIICNAGSGHFGSLEQFSAQQIEQQIQLNLISPILIIRELIPQLKQNGGGDIIIIGSESALKGGRYGSIYSASKAGLRGFAQALKEECANAAIRVTLINPGMVDSAFFDKLTFKPGNDASNSIEAQHIADTISLVLNTAATTVFDEINLSPLKKVVQAKAKE